ncbi:hypothetical protein [Lentibacillus salicampi]|uniref:hypothetical protein n=1 Tax=Lentibacillus salicampi TaxID=175306 RepID=UPI0014315E3E|nr:hypothetical protein [Lentibacillus salicampi]
MKGNLDNYLSNNSGYVYWGKVKDGERIEHDEEAKENSNAKPNPWRGISIFFVF